MGDTSGERRSDHAATTALAEARAACARRDWAEALSMLRAADGDGALDAAALELMADCARWRGEGAVVVEALERAHGGHAAAGDLAAAARTALALCHAHADVCQVALAASWLAVAERLLADLPDGPEHGVLAWFQGRRCAERCDLAGQEAHARRAYELARRFGDRNVEALALIDLAQVASSHGRTADALAALDAATGLAISGGIGVLEAGIVFCNAIVSYRSRGEWGRALEWTDCSSRWVQREGVAYFPGLCRVHRAEVLRVRGELVAAEHESREAARALREAVPRWEIIALGELGEVLRRRGDFAGAMAAFRRALELGWDPQPGLALVMLAQGDARAAHRALVRALEQPGHALVCQQRPTVLGACVTVAVAAGDLAAAAAATAALESWAERTPWEDALAARAAAELALARHDPETAIPMLLRARATWAELDAPYEVATCAELLGRAMAAAGDREGAGLELGAAQAIFSRIEARADARRVGAVLAAGDAGVAVREAPQPPASMTARLRCEGDVWSIEFGERTLRLKDSRGMRYLAALLAEPGRERWALELVSGDGASADGAPGDEGPGDEMLDRQARAECRRRLEELAEELAEAQRDHDESRIDPIRAEMDALAQHLAAAIGLGGRARRSGGAAERARQSVTKAIRGAVRRIGESDGVLGRRLEAAVRTGMACCYEPERWDGVSWLVEGV